VNYTRPVSATRQLAVEFNAGASLVRIPGLEAEDSRHPFGEATVAWRFSTMWQVWGTARRGLDLVPGLRTPVLGNAVTAELNGLVHPRVTVHASARYSSGASVVSDRAQPFESHSAGLQMRYALSRELAVQAEYFYYFYDFQGTGLAVGIPARFERTGVRLGLTMWVPALRR